LCEPRDLANGGATAPSGRTGLAGSEQAPTALVPLRAIRLPSAPNRFLVDHATQVSAAVAHWESAHATLPQAFYMQSDSVVFARRLRWSRQRQVVVLRRRLKEGVAVAGRDDAGQLTLGFVEIGPGAEAYEYAVLVTALDGEVRW
jgi:hypothetical protein